MNKNLNLSVDIGGLTIKSPVMSASGTFGYASEFKDAVDLNRLGAVIVKSISLEPRKGNPAPRVVETSCGMLNAIGLENIGFESFIKEKLPFIKTLDTPLIININGKTFEDYVNLAERINDVDEIAGIEVNISCPNVKAGGVAFGTNPEIAQGLTAAIRSKTDKLLMVKLSPNVTDITEIAKSVEQGGADAVSLINTITGMAIDINTRKPKLANITGGLSGPAIKPVALRMVWQTAKAVKIPVIGIGGITTAEDALEFLIAGATAIQVGTANMINPSATIEILDGIIDYMSEKGIKNVFELIGEDF